MKLTRCSIAALSLGLASCGDGQAGSEYRGEPLMNMSGVVRSTAFALEEGLVPALVMRESPFDAGLLRNPTRTNHFVQGEVEGSFPSAFTLRLYDAPPAVALDALLDGDPAFTLAFITAVSPAHPAWLRTTEYEGSHEEGGYQRDEMCSATQCYSALHNCPEGEQDPNSLWPCGNRFPSDVPFASYGYARGHVVLYVAGPVTAGSVLSQMYAGGVALAKGYHVLERDDAALASSGDCQRRAEQRALDALNRANGTQWTRNDVYEDPRAWNKQRMMATVAEGCPSGFKLVQDTASAPVELELIDQASTQWLAF